MGIDVGMNSFLPKPVTLKHLKELSDSAEAVHAPDYLPIVSICQQVEELEQENLLPGLSVYSQSDIHDVFPSLTTTKPLSRRPYSEGAERCLKRHCLESAQVKKAYQSYRSRGVI